MKLQQLPVFLFITTLSSASPLNFQRRGDSQYPASDEVPDISLTPQSWTDALNSAKCELDGLLPFPPCLFCSLTLPPIYPLTKLPGRSQTFLLLPTTMETSVTLTMWDPTRISVLGQFRSVTVPMTFTQLPRTSSESVSLLSEVFPRKKGKRLLIAFLSDSLFLPPPFFLLRPSPCLSGLSPLAVSLLSQALTMDQLRLRLISTTS